MLLSQDGSKFVEAILHCHKFCQLSSDVVKICLKSLLSQGRH